MDIALLPMSFQGYTVVRLLIDGSKWCSTDSGLSRDRETVGGYMVFVDLNTKAQSRDDIEEYVVIGVVMSMEVGAQLIRIVKDLYFP